MKILIVSQYFHPEVFRINQLALALQDQGHRVVVLTGQPNYPSGRFFPGYGFFHPVRETYDGIEVLRVPIFPRGSGRAWQLVLNYISFVVFATLIGLPRLWGRRFDVCVSWCSSPITGAIPAAFYRFFTRTPVAIWVQDLWPETFFAVTKSRNRILRQMLSRTVRWIYGHVDQIWIQSTAYQDSVRAHGGRPEQIEFVPNWAEDFYDCDRWSDLQTDAIPEKSLVFAGNLGRAQGLETLLAAAELTLESVPDVHWIFVGDGTLRDWLAAEIEDRQLQSRVRILPRRNADEMPKIMKPAAALLVTLANDPVYARTIPSKVQSCLASGRPIIASLFGEPAKVIERADAGLVCAPEDASALAKLIKDFFSLSEKDRERFGRNGHAYYRAHFTQRNVIDKIVALLERMDSDENRGARSRRNARPQNGDDALEDVS